MASAVLVLFAYPVLADQVSHSAQYTYNDANQITSVTYDNDKEITYTYDSRGNMTGIASNDILPISSDPPDQAEDVPIGQVVSATFSEDIQATIDIGQITIKHGETAIAYTYSISDETISLTPSQALENYIVYQVTIPAGCLEGVSGHALCSDFIFIFTTEPIPVTGVSLNKTTANISVQGADILIATISPANASNQNVTWTSSDTDIVTVDTAGNITGISEGTATVTVTTEDGSFTDDCTVTVSL